MEKSKMSYTEANKRATIKYQKANYKSINIKFRHNEIAILKDLASAKGMSATAYCIAAIKKQIAEDTKEE